MSAIPCTHPEGITVVPTSAGFRIIAAVDNATRTLGVDLRVTCGAEDHAPDDPHSRGLALDVGIRGIPAALLLKVITFLKQTLGPLFTVLLETPVPLVEPSLAAIQTINPHATAPHLHLQLAKSVPVWPPLEGTVNA